MDNLALWPAWRVNPSLTCFVRCCCFCMLVASQFIVWLIGVKGSGQRAELSQEVWPERYGRTLSRDWPSSVCAIFSVRIQTTPSPSAVAGTCGGSVGGAWRISDYEVSLPGLGRKDDQSREGGERRRGSS